MLQDLLQWCVRYTDILTAKDNSWKKKSFAKFVSQKGQNLLLEECCKSVGIEVDFKSNDQPQPVWTYGEMLDDILKWCGKHTNLLSAKTEQGEGLIHYASMKGYSTIVDNLIKNGVVIELKGIQNQSPLNLALQHENLEVAKILIQNGANINSLHMMETSLHRAAKLGKVEVAKFLIKHGSNVNSLITKTPLYLACDEGHVEMAKLLLKNGAYSLLGDITPLYVACRRGHVDILRLLLKNTANVTLERKFLLHAALEMGHLEVAKLLIQHGANVNARDREQSTPLHIACKKGNLELVKLLVEHGARTDFHDQDMYTPLHIASKLGNVELARYLIQNGAIINSKFLGSSTTPLHIASFYGRTEIVKLLLDHGCSLRLKDEQNKRALDLAKQKGHYQIVELIRQKILDSSSQEEEVLEEESLVPSAPPMEDLEVESLKVVSAPVENPEDCIICFNPKNGIFAFRPCCHANTCEQCCVRILSSPNATCPICRKKVNNYDKIYV